MVITDEMRQAWLALPAEDRQPVDIPGGSVLRTVLGAAQLKDLVSGKQPLDQMIEADRVLLSKLALIARQYDYLLSHSL